MQTLVSAEPVKGMNLNLKMNTPQAAVRWGLPVSLECQALPQTSGTAGGTFLCCCLQRDSLGRPLRIKGKCRFQVFSREGIKPHHSGAFSCMAKGWPKGPKTKILPPGFMRRVALQSSNVLICPKQKSCQVVGNRAKIDSMVREILKNVLLLSQHIDFFSYHSRLN